MQFEGEDSGVGFVAGGTDGKMTGDEVQKMGVALQAMVKYLDFVSALKRSHEKVLSRRGI